MTTKELKIRIKGVQSIQKITKAMKMVSASKLRLILENLEVATKYSSIVAPMISFDELKGSNVSGKNIHLLVTSDRGLCGSHSSSVCKYYVSLDTTSTDKLVLLGSKAVEILGKNSPNKVDASFTNIFKRGFSFVELSGISNKLNKLFVSKDVSNLGIIYNKYVSAVKTSVELVSLDISMLLKKDVELSTVIHTNGVKNFSQFSVFSLLYFYICSSKASEESTRRAAMDNATSSATELLDNLTKLYNMMRQASITTELIEIVSGAESLKQSKN